MLKHINHFLCSFKKIIFDDILNANALYFKLNLLYIPKYYKNIKTRAIFKPVPEEDKTVPLNLFLCYKHKKIPDKIITSLELANPGWSIFLFDDAECSAFMHAYDPVLGEMFDRIPDGPIKADIFRICILASRGGVYTDVDNVLLVPLASILKDNITFGVGGSYLPEQVNPAFLISTKDNAILLQCIRLYKDFINKTPYTYWGYSIVYCMTYVLREYIKIQNRTEIHPLKEINQRIQVFEERREITLSEILACALDPGKNVSNYYFLHDENKNKIINLHSPLYDSERHHFINE